jgi:hypothetical protein
MNITLDYVQSLDCILNAQNLKKLDQFLQQLEGEMGSYSAGSLRKASPVISK